MKHLTLLLVLLAAAPASAETVVISLDRAIEIAVQQQPTLKQQRAQIEAARGRVDSAKVARKPTVSLGASASAGSSRSGFCQPADTDGDGQPDGLPVTCGGFFSPQITTSIGANASWRIYDFGATDTAVRAAELSAEATEAAVATSLLDIRTNVEVAYLEAVARERLIHVAETTVANEDAHVAQAKAFVDAGARDPIEVTQAQSRAATARSTLAQYQSSQAIALANLRSAMGWADATQSPTVVDAWPAPPETEPGALPDLVEQARTLRPEIAATDKQIAAAEASFDVAGTGRRPVLSASASTQWNPGTTEWRPEPSWNASVSLTWQIYDGGRMNADKRIARANVSVAEAQRDALLVSLTSELELARAQIVTNRANVTASTEAVIAARAQLALADARYAQGLGSQIEIADAQTAVTTAEGNLVQAEWQLATAWTQLRRAIGTTR